MTIPDFEMKGSVEDFKKELYDLLKKYNVEISFETSPFSDMSEIFDGRMSIVDIFHGREISVLCKSESICADDLIK